MKREICTQYRIGNPSFGNEDELPTFTVEMTKETTPLYATYFTMRLTIDDKGNEDAMPMTNSAKERLKVMFSDLIDGIGMDEA